MFLCRSGAGGSAPFGVPNYLEIREDNRRYDEKEKDKLIAVGSIFCGQEKGIMILGVCVGMTVCLIYDRMHVIASFTFYVDDLHEE